MQLGATLGLWWGYSGPAVALYWACCGETNGAVMTHAANGKTQYYGELRARARACSLGLHWGSASTCGTTLGLWWNYTGACGGPHWSCDDTQSLVGKHHTTVSRARACSLGPHWGFGGATLELLWGYTEAAVGPQWGCDDTQSLVGKHYTTLSRARARAGSLGTHWPQGLW